MKDINNLKDYFSLKNDNQYQNLEKSYNFTPFSLDPQNSTPIKNKENFTNRDTYKIENPAKNLDHKNINEKFNTEKINNHNDIMETGKIKSQLEEIDIKINTNLNHLETLKSSLNKIKSEKNEKNSQIVNLLSNRESVDEIYKNYIEYIKSKNSSNKKNKKKIKKEIKNPFENQDEDTFEILINEIKQIDLIKFIDQCLNLIEEIFENPKRLLKMQLKEVINKSFSIFNNEISISNFIDTYSIVSNFFLRISIFLSNQSFGKYSETMINLLLRCLLKINSINVKNEELINYMNGQYKNEKNKIKEEMNNLLLENENLNTNKILLEKKISELNDNKENDNKNNLKNVINSTNNKAKKNNIEKKNIFKEKLKDMVKKVYQEDFEGKNGLNEYYYFTENKKSENVQNFNKKLNEFISNTEIKNNDNFEIEQRYSFKISDKANNDSNDFKRYNTINFNEKNKISQAQNFQYTSPQMKNKKQSYYRQNNNNINNINKNNGNGQGLRRVISNEKKKDKGSQKIANFRYNNKIITYNDIKKNMKFDLAKKIKYLDKVSKNGMNSFSKSSVQNKRIKLIYKQDKKMKRLSTTEKKEEFVKYNFFDIIQETNKLRNRSGENNYKVKNRFNGSNNNLLLTSSKKKIINGKYDISKNLGNTNIKNFENLIKSDFTTNKKKSIFNKNGNIIQINLSMNKTKKNGLEKNEIINNDSNTILQKSKLNKIILVQNKKKILNGGPINKNEKIEKKIMKSKLGQNQSNKNNFKKNNVKISIKGKIKKELNRKEVYHIIADTKDKIDNNILLKSENINAFDKNNKLNISDYDKKINSPTNTGIKSEISNEKKSVFNLDY